MSLMQSGPAEHAAVEALQHILSEANVSPDDLAVLHIRDAASFGEVLERVLCSEEAMRLAQFWNFRLDIRGLGPLKHVWQVLLTPYTAADHRQVSFRLRHLAAQPYFESRPQWKDLSEQLTHDVNTSLITRVSVPLLVNYAEIAARWDAIRQAAQLGLAAEQYRFRYDKLPAQLDDLAPEFIPAVPLDPFDGKPMRMKRTEHGLIIYSIGPDMVDDGGAPLALSPDGKLTGDITFEALGWQALIARLR